MPDASELWPVDESSWLNYWDSVDSGDAIWVMQASPWWSTRKAGQLRDAVDHLIVDRLRSTPGLRVERLILYDLPSDVGARPGPHSQQTTIHEEWKRRLGMQAVCCARAPEATHQVSMLILGRAGTADGEPLQDRLVRNREAPWSHVPAASIIPLSVDGIHYYGPVEDDDPNVRRSLHSNANDFSIAR